MQKSVELLFTLAAYTGQDYKIETKIVKPFLESANISLDDFTKAWPNNPHLRQNEAFIKLNELKQVQFL